MKIAFTHNLQLSSSEEEAEYDRPETVTAIAESLRRLEHVVEPIDVAGPASRVVARLEALAPDLVFNTAEGTRGRFREAFYPALFDRLGLAFTGSDAYVCALTLDKQLTKMVVANQGIPTPRWVFVEQLEQLEALGTGALHYPLMVKPNFEGSSMGITADSVVETPLALRARAEELLARFPEGLLVEEFIDGDDLTVPFLEKASSASGGVLEPAQYTYDEQFMVDRRFKIYDYEMKTQHYDAVHVSVPAQIPKEQRERAIDLTRRAVRAIGIRDAARVDFRIDCEGKLHFIEVNALPSLEPGASLYAAAALAGLKDIDAVMGTIVRSAADRFGLDIPKLKRSRRRGPVRVGLAYNLKRIANVSEGDVNVDDEAEFDSPETIGAIRDAIASYGHEVIDLEATPELPTILPAAGVDVVFNVAEGIEGRTRESQVPAMLELLGIPYTGSDPTTMSLSLDKALAKRLVTQAGLRTPPFVLMMSGRERLPKALTFPVIVKPVAEGSSKGIVKKSVAEDEGALRELVREMAARYRQAVLVESYLPGREFTVALLGERRPRVLPIMEVVFLDKKQKFPLYSFETKYFENTVRFDVPADVPPELTRELERVARGAFSVLGCRDLARVDLRLDESGKVHFVECNPLPGLTPGFSDFCVIAQKAGMDFRALVGEILAPALRRFRERQKERLLAGRG